MANSGIRMVGVEIAIIRLLHTFKLLLFLATVSLTIAAICLYYLDPVFAQSTNDPRLTKVKNLRLGLHFNKTRVVMDTDGPVEYTVFSLADPYRLILDISEVDFQIPRGLMDVPVGGILGYRFGLFEPGVSRVVIDLAEPMIIDRAFQLKPGTTPWNRLVLDLKKASREKFLRVMVKQSNRRQKIKHKSSIRKKNPLPILSSQNTSHIKIIAIDPGHGGVDPGAIGTSGIYEKRLVLAAAKTFERVLTQSGRYKVILTRRTDRFLPLRKRVSIARMAKADLFISLHADSIENSSVRGATIYTLSENASDKEAAQLADRENKVDIISGMDLSSETPEVTDILIDLVQRETMNQSARFAGKFVTELTSKVRTHRRPHKFAGFAVLKAPDIPSILLEMGYLSNLYDEKLLKTEGFREKLALALLKGLDHYFFSKK